MEPRTFLVKPGIDNQDQSLPVRTILNGLHTFLVCIARASTDRAVWLLGPPTYHRESKDRV